MLLFLPHHYEEVTLEREWHCSYCPRTIPIRSTFPCIFQVISLTEKLQSKAAALTAAAASVNDPASLGVPKKAEDRLSTGSGGSAVVDANQLLHSSEESCLPDGYHSMGPVDVRVHSEEDDASDEGCNYYSEEDAQLGWWVWN